MPSEHWTCCTLWYKRLQTSSCNWRTQVPSSRPPRPHVASHTHTHTYCLPLPTQIFLKPGSSAAFRGPAWVTAEPEFLTHCWAIAEELGAAGVCAVCTVLNTSGIPGNPPSHPSFPIYLFIYLFIFIYLLFSRVHRRGAPTFCIILLPWGEKADKWHRKIDFVHCGKVSVCTGEKNAFHIPSTWRI